MWPEVPEDRSPYVPFSREYSRLLCANAVSMMYSWQPDQFYRHREFSQEYQEAAMPSASAKPVKNEAEAYENQAKELLEGKQTWKPTWQALGLSYNRPALAKLNGGAPKEIPNQKKEESKETKEGEGLELIDDISSPSVVDSTSSEQPKSS